MTKVSFKALVVEQVGGVMHGAIREVGTQELPAGDVLVRVKYSSLNYKDGLAVTGRGKVIRSYPMVPGIDLAGTVEESGSPAFKRGDAVILTGWGVGEQHWGGYSQLARVKSDWLLPLPAGLSLKQAMAIGTAGLTAMLCLLALEERGLTPEKGEVVVTGAGGGVGSVAVALLAKLGYRVVASTGRPELHGYLRGLGAQQIIDRSVLATPGTRPLESERWSGAIDSVGGDTLASLLRSMAYGASVAACGLAGGHQLQTTVLPFILRSVSLVGVDSVYCPQARRSQAWARLTRNLSLETLDNLTRVVPLESIPALSEDILQGRVRGRIVVDLSI